MHTHVHEGVRTCFPNINENSNDPIGGFVSPTLLMTCALGNVSYISVEISSLHVCMCICMYICIALMTCVLEYVSYIKVEISSLHVCICTHMYKYMHVYVYVCIYV